MVKLILDRNTLLVGYGGDSLLLGEFTPKGFISSDRLKNRELFLEHLKSRKIPIGKY